MNETMKVNRFTCPKCGCHYWGSYTLPSKFFNDKIPESCKPNENEKDIFVGFCKGFIKDTNSRCDFKWNRRTEDNKYFHDDLVPF